MNAIYVSLYISFSIQKNDFIFGELYERKETNRVVKI